MTAEDKADGDKDGGHDGDDEARPGVVDGKRDDNLEDAHQDAEPDQTALFPFRVLDLPLVEADQKERDHHPGKVLVDKLQHDGLRVLRRYRLVKGTFQQTFSIASSLFSGYAGVITNDKGVAEWNRLQTTLIIRF